MLNVIQILSCQVCDLSPSLCAWSSALCPWARAFIWPSARQSAPYWKFRRVPPYLQKYSWSTSTACHRFISTQYLPKSRVLVHLQSRCWTYYFTLSWLVHLSVLKYLKQGSVLSIIEILIQFLHLLSVMFGFCCSWLYDVMYCGNSSQYI